MAWSYEGKTGPAHWAHLSLHFSPCAGKEQSPVDLAGAVTKALPPLAYDYHPAPGTAFDTGTRSIQVDLQGGALAIGDDRYDLVQFHFHTPAEHVRGSRTWRAEIHLVHADADGNVAVLGVFVARGDENAFMKRLSPHLPGQARAGAPVALLLTDLLPHDRSYLTYPGSLTTPPCHEGLRWIVLTTPVSFSEEQLALLERYFPAGNARPLQPLHGRTIYCSHDDA